MKIEDQVTLKSLQKIVRDQGEEEYSTKGWEVTREENMGANKADLVVRKGQKTIVFEIKTGPFTEEKKDQVEHLSEEIKKLGYEFRLLIASPPKERDIEIIGLDHLFFEHFIDNIPQELTDLSSATRIND